MADETTSEIKLANNVREDKAREPEKKNKPKRNTGGPKHGVKNSAPRNIDVETASAKRIRDGINRNNGKGGKLGHKTAKSTLSDNTKSSHQDASWRMNWLLLSDDEEFDPFNRTKKYPETDDMKTGSRSSAGGGIRRWMYGKSNPVYTSPWSTPRSAAREPQYYTYSAGLTDSENIDAALLALETSSMTPVHEAGWYDHSKGKTPIESNLATTEICPDMENYDMVQDDVLVEHIEQSGEDVESFSGGSCVQIPETETQYESEKDVVKTEEEMESTSKLCVDSPIVASDFTASNEVVDILQSEGEKDVAKEESCSGLCGGETELNGDVGNNQSEGEKDVVKIPEDIESSAKLCVVETLPTDSTNLTSSNRDVMTSHPEGVQDVIMIQDDVESSSKLSAGETLTTDSADLTSSNGDVTIIQSKGQKDAVNAQDVMESNSELYSGETLTAAGSVAGQSQKAVTAEQNISDSPHNSVELTASNGDVMISQSEGEKDLVMSREAMESNSKMYIRDTLTANITDSPDDDVLIMWRGDNPGVSVIQVGVINPEIECDEDTRGGSMKCQINKEPEGVNTMSDAILTQDDTTSVTVTAGTPELDNPIDTVGHVNEDHVKPNDTVSNADDSSKDEARDDIQCSKDANLTKDISDQHEIDINSIPTTSRGEAVQCTQLHTADESNPFSSCQTPDIVESSSSVDFVQVSDTERNCITSNMTHDKDELKQKVTVDEIPIVMYAHKSTDVQTDLSNERHSNIDMGQLLDVCDKASATDNLIKSEMQQESICAACQVEVTDMEKHFIIEHLMSTDGDTTGAINRDKQATTTLLTTSKHDVCCQTSDVNMLYNLTDNNGNADAKGNICTDNLQNNEKGCDSSTQTTYTDTKNSETAIDIATPCVNTSSISTIDIGTDTQLDIPVSCSVTSPISMIDKGTDTELDIPVSRTYFISKTNKGYDTELDKPDSCIVTSPISKANKGTDTELDKHVPVSSDTISKADKCTGTQLDMPVACGVVPPISKTSKGNDMDRPLSFIVASAVPVKTKATDTELDRVVCAELSTIERKHDKATMICQSVSTMAKLDTATDTSIRNYASFMPTVIPDFTEEVAQGDIDRSISENVGISNIKYIPETRGDKGRTHFTKFNCDQHKDQSTNTDDYLVKHTIQPTQKIVKHSDTANAVHNSLRGQEKTMSVMQSDFQNIKRSTANACRICNPMKAKKIKKVKPVKNDRTISQGDVPVEGTVTSKGTVSHKVESLDKPTYTPLPQPTLVALLLNQAEIKDSNVSNLIDISALSYVDKFGGNRLLSDSISTKTHECRVVAALEPKSTSRNKDQDTETKTRKTREIQSVMDPKLLHKKEKKEYQNALRKSTNNSVIGQKNVQAKSGDAGTVKIMVDDYRNLAKIEESKHKG